MSISSIEIDPLVSDVFFRKDSMHVVLADGREIVIPLGWLPKLRDATSQQREDWRLIAGGAGIHWEEPDEDVLVDDLLATRGAPRTVTQRLSESVR